MVAPLIPLEVQTPLAVNVTRFPEPPPIALTLNGAALVSLLLIGANAMDWPALLMINVNAFRSDAAGFAPAGLATLTMALNVPVADGVPEITPVEVLIDKPGGKPVALYVSGKLLPVSVKLNACPNVPNAKLTLVTAVERGMVN